MLSTPQLAHWALDGAFTSGPWMQASATAAEQRSPAILKQACRRQQDFFGMSTFQRVRALKMAPSSPEALVAGSEGKGLRFILRRTVEPEAREETSAWFSGSGSPSGRDASLSPAEETDWAASSGLCSRAACSAEGLFSSLARFSPMISRFREKCENVEFSGCSEPSSSPCRPTSVSKICRMRGRVSSRGRRQAATRGMQAGRKTQPSGHVGSGGRRRFRACLMVLALKFARGGTPVATKATRRPKE
mmetsp:Transcript_64704/g.189325  ORF Transcript_64704/g.189325 Transcript_64704/m.189325 type:complete len:247 (-) Transcript_64704:409-1149(-)